MSSAQRILYTLVAPALVLLAVGCGGGGGDGGDGDAAVTGSGGAPGAGGSGAGGAGNDAGTGSGGAPGSGGVTGSGGAAGAGGSGTGGAGGSAGGSGSSLSFDEGGVTRNADTSETYFLTASLATSGMNRILTIRATQLVANAAGMKGSFQIGLFKNDGPIVAGTYGDCQVMHNGGTSAADIWSSQGGACSLTLTSVPTASGQRVVGTFTATLRGLLSATPKMITNGKLDVTASVASN
jgi:hypothetical protein